MKYEIRRRKKMAEKEIEIMRRKKKWRKGKNQKLLSKNSLNGCVCVFRMRTIGVRDRIMTSISSSFSFSILFERKFTWIIAKMQRESFFVVDEKSNTMSINKKT